MCRLLGIVASEPTEFRIVLKEAPRSLAVLSREHRDGWGLAVWDERRDWRIEKGIACAEDDENFHRLAVGTRGELLVAHIRHRTVGLTSIDNTHPFQRGRWVFAHNGTIKDVAYLRERVSAHRKAEIRGETDSELFFAFLLTRLDAAGLTDKAPDGATDVTIRQAVRDVRGRPDFGACNFLLADSNCTYAHRFGRSLYLLERVPGDVVRVLRESREGVIVQTPWSERRHAILVASERLTDEPWQEIDDGMLVRVDRLPLPRWRLVDAAMPAAQPA
jgi:predicted glutamine amidotransferase